MFEFEVDVASAEVTLDNPGFTEPHVQVAIGFTIPIGSERLRRHLLHTIIPHHHRQAQSCQTLSDGEIQVWEQTITEILTEDMDQNTTALVSITITCITESTISFDTIFQEVCNLTCLASDDAANLADTLVAGIETSLETSINDGSFVESLQENAVEVAASCIVDCEALDDISNITSLGTPTFEVGDFVFVVTVSSPSLSSIIIYLLYVTIYYDLINSRLIPDILIYLQSGYQDFYISTSSDTFIIACKCSSDTYDCNTNALGPDDTLGICIKLPASDTDYELQNLTSLSIDQANTNQSLQVIQDNEPVNSELSEIIDAGAISFINTVVPSRFFESGDSIIVSGAVEVVFSSGSRQLLLIATPETEEDVSQPHPPGEVPQVSIDRSMEEEPQWDFGFRVGLIEPVTVPHQKVVSSSGANMMRVGTTHILGALFLFWAYFRRW